MDRIDRNKMPCVISPFESRGPSQSTMILAKFTEQKYSPWNIMIRCVRLLGKKRLFCENNSDNSMLFRIVWCHNCQNLKLFQGQFLWEKDYTSSNFFWKEHRNRRVGATEKIFTIQFLWTWKSIFFQGTMILKKLFLIAKFSNNKKKHLCDGLWFLSQ